MREAVIAGTAPSPRWECACALVAEGSSQGPECENDRTKCAQGGRCTKMVCSTERVCSNSESVSRGDRKKVQVGCCAAEQARREDIGELRDHESVLLVTDVAAKDRGTLSNDYRS